MKGAKTEDGKDVRAKMWDLILDCMPGTILAVVKSGVNVHEFVAVQHGAKEVWPDISTKRGLTLDLLDALKDGGAGISIGGMLVQMGLAKEEVREEKYVQGEDLYYVVRRETAKCERKVQFLQFLRQHEAYLATRLEQFKVRARTENNPADSARFVKIRQRIEDFQSKLKVIQERREKTEKDGKV